MGEYLIINDSKNNDEMFSQMREQMRSNHKTGNYRTENNGKTYEDGFKEGCEHGYKKGYEHGLEDAGQGSSYRRYM